MTQRSQTEPAVGTSTMKPDGPAVAALLALGIGAVVLGFLTTLAAASTTVNGWLALNSGVGPLSGKTIFAGSRGWQRGLCCTPFSACVRG